MFGWGGEDDMAYTRSDRTPLNRVTSCYLTKRDVSCRYVLEGFKVRRYKNKMVGRYYSIEHERDRGNPKSNRKYACTLNVTCWTSDLSVFRVVGGRTWRHLWSSCITTVSTASIIQWLMWVRGSCLRAFSSTWRDRDRSSRCANTSTITCNSWETRLASNTLLSISDPWQKCSF